MLFCVSWMSQSKVIRLQTRGTEPGEQFGLWPAEALPRPAHTKSGDESPQSKSRYMISLSSPPDFTPSSAVGITRAGRPWGWGNFASGAMPRSSYMLPIRSQG